MATVIAKTMKINVGASAVTCQTNASISMSLETFDVTCKDSGTDKEMLPGDRSWSASGEAYLDFSATNGFEDLFDAMTARTEVDITFGTGVTGTIQLVGSGYITKLDLSAQGNNAGVTFTYEISGNGELTKDTV
jgi:predicted secreted protein